MKEFFKEVFDLYDKKWGLLTAGKKGNFNSMTISWGGVGTLWNKPVVTVYVNPRRYTHEFMEENEYFTVSFYGEQYREALALLGTKSGREGDKVAESGLTPVYLDDAVTYEEAEITLLCRKIYRQDLERRAMEPQVIKAQYEHEKPHTMYVGEVVKILE